MSITRTAIAVSLFIAFASVLTHAQRQNVASKVAEQRMKSVVVVADVQPDKIVALGAGTIIDGRGYVLTCNHVIEGIEQISVGFLDGQYLPATVIFRDKAADVVLLKVDRQRDFPAVPLAPADLKPGEPMIVIGNPSGLVFTVSAGIVSRIADFQQNGVISKNAIQTDAPINPGNSGGPVFNGDGEFVGMVFKFLPERDGIAWAINGDEIELALARDCSALKIAGVVHGIALREEVSSEGPTRRGVFVSSPDGAGHAALIKGDRILKVGVTSKGTFVNRTIASLFEFENALWDSKPGDKVMLTVLRGSTQVTITLTLTGSGVDRAGQ